VSMDRVRRLLVVGVASLSLLSTLALTGPAAAAKHRVVVATGSITCTKVTGSITFSPPVHHVATGPETQTFSFHASGCTTRKSNVRSVTSGYLSYSVHRPNNSCLGLLAAEPSTGSGTWTPRWIHATTASFSGFTFVDNTTGDVGFTVPNTNGTARTTGSFTGGDHGARSTATIYINMTALQFRDACLSPAGVARQIVTGGTAHFG